VSYLPPIFQQNSQYSARVTRQFLDDVATAGVVGPNAFAVTERGAGAAMAVDVAAGRAYIRGTDQANQGLYLCITEATVEVPVEPADPSLGRIDLVVAEVRDPNAGGVAGDDWQFRVVEGTPDAAPVVPSVPDSAIALAEIVVGAGVTSIQDVSLTDRRSFSDAKSGGVGFTYAGTRYFTSSGTFEKADPLGTGDIGLRAIRVTCIGGGGGGSGGDGASPRGGNGGGGGGGRIAFITDLSTLSASETVTLGSGGAGSPNGASGAGGQTTFGALIGANGGGGTQTGGSAGLGGAGIVGSAASIGFAGSVGTPGGAANNMAGGSGGGASLGFGGGGAGIAPGNFNNAGAGGQFFGGGGGGARAFDASTVGGAGAAGLIIVDCFV
jgi:hypothetical protein